MPKAIKKRIAKKTGDTETEVKERLSSLKDTLRHRQKTVLKFGVVIIVVLAVLVGFLVHSYTAQKKARTLEYEAYKIYYSNPQVQGPDKQGQYKTALDMFRKAYDASKSPLSLFYIAACYDDLANYDEALKTLKDFANSYSKDQTYIPLVYQKMAAIYIKKGDTGEAKKTLDTLINLKGAIYKDFALFEYARLLEKEGKKDEANKKYHELVAGFPNSPFAGEAKARLEAEKKAG
jgi:predicted negative regulator of RcsB-dependent stress response